jgi:RNA polymerase sigma-70 factor (ECF subfamily)
MRAGLSNNHGFEPPNAVGCPRTLEELLGTILGDRERLLAWTTSRLGDRDAARDVLQDASLKAVERFSTVRDPATVRWWFERVLAHTITDYHRRRLAYRRLLERFERLSSTGVDDEHRGDRLPMASPCPCLRPALRTLAAGHAEMLRLIDLEERTPAEVARALGISPNNARVRLHRARRALRGRLARTCGGSPLLSCSPCQCGRSRGVFVREDGASPGDAPSSARRRPGRRVGDQQTISASRRLSSREA